MVDAESFEVEVVYALPDRQCLVTVRVAPGTRVEAAVRQSGILLRFPEIDLARTKLGVFGRRVGPEQTLRAGDRIEIYRPLLADPKTVRRERSKAARSRA